MSLPVAAARPMKLPTSMCSGATRQSPPCSSVTPWMRSTFDSIPSIWAPSETRKRQRSWTCGSQAAFPITVSPSASTAAMTTFSVAITLASSRKIDFPRSFGARISKRPLTSISTPSSARPWMCGSSRRRPMTSPPGGGTIALPSRASSGPASRNEARIRRQSSSSRSDLWTPTGSIRISFSPSHSASAPMSTSSSTIVCTSRIRGTFVSCTGSDASTVAARIGSAPFLFPAARTVPLSGRPPSITKACIPVESVVAAMRRGIVVGLCSRRETQRGRR